MIVEERGRRIWIAGRQVEIWECSGGSICITPSAIEAYARAGRWEAAFNALVLLGDSEPRGLA